MMTRDTVDSVLRISQGFLTPVIAGITIYIACQQLKTNRQKLKLDTYERRLRIYEQVIAYIRLVVRNFKPEIYDHIRFAQEAAVADFLFGPEIPKYIDELFQRGLELDRWHAEFRDLTQAPRPGYDHSKVVAGMHEQETWFIKQPDVAKEKFRKYLRMDW